MKRIAISGIPGSGKTSLARGLASACCGTLKNVELVNEYAREYISKYKSVDTIWEQLRITEKQIEREDNIVSKTDILITDSPIYLGFLFAIDLVDFDNAKDVIAYNDLFCKLTALRNRYDLIVHLYPVIGPVEDGVRINLHFNEQWRSKSNSILLNQLGMFGQKNIIEIQSKDITERVETCLKIFREKQWLV